MRSSKRRIDCQRQPVVSTPKSQPDHRRSGICCACALVLWSAVISGCGILAEQTAGMLSVRHAQQVTLAGAPVLQLDLDCRLSGPMLDALDQGIPLTLRVDVRTGHWPGTRAHATRSIELRYFPLSRRYQMRIGDDEDVRSFATPAYLVAALGSVRLQLPSTFATVDTTNPLHVSAALDPAALPGALRLPALFEPAWRLVAADTTWTDAAR